MSTVHLALQNNRVLARLPDSERGLILPFLEVVNLSHREFLDKVGDPNRYLYFPINSAISIIDARAQQNAVEVMVVGKEGCSNPFVVVDVSKAIYTSLVQIGGSALRLPISVVKTNRESLSRLHALLARYTGVMMRHAVLSVGCGRFHRIEQRIARWLLAHRDRTGLQTFPFTPDFIAMMVGADLDLAHESLTLLLNQGVLRYNEGCLEVLNYASVERRACECFLLAKQAIGEYLEEIEAL